MPLSTPAEVTIESGYGPITVTAELLRIWNSYGWPSEPCLRDMAENEKLRATAAPGVSA